MRRILASLLVMVTLGGVVASGTLAVFTDTATIAGVSVNSSTADLKIGDDTEDHADNLNGPFNLPFNFYPGLFVQWNTPGNEPLNLYNVSTGNFSLSIFAQITHWESTQGNWSALANAVQVRVVNVTDTLNPVFGGWHTLQEWHDTGFQLPGAPIPVANPSILFSGKGSYGLELYIDSSVGNEIAGANLNNMTITFTGTQVL